MFPDMFDQGGCQYKHISYFLFLSSFLSFHLVIDSQIDYKWIIAMQGSGGSHFKFLQWQFIDI